MEQYFNIQLQLTQFQLANEKQQNVLLQEQIANEKALNHELVNELESKCNELQQLLQLYEATTQQNDQIQQVNVSLQTSFQNCSQNNQSISINTSYTQIYTQQQNRINEYEKYITKLSASNEKIKSQYDDLNSIISDKLQEIEKINSKDKEKALENPLQIDPELLNCKNRDIQRLQQQYENVNRKYMCAQDEYELMKERNNQSQSQVQQLKAEIARMNEKLKMKENSCDRLQSESKCPLLKTIQELKDQNKIEAQQSLQFQHNFQQPLQFQQLTSQQDEQINVKDTIQRAKLQILNQDDTFCLSLNPEQDTESENEQVYKTSEPQICKYLQRQANNGNCKMLKQDSFTESLKIVLNQTYAKNFSNKSPKELCEFMNSKKLLQKGFWKNVAKLCNQKPDAAKQYYSNTYSKVLYSENLSQSDKVLIRQRTKEIFEAEKGLKLSVLKIAKLINEQSFLKRDLFIADIENVAAVELKKLKK
ncbi:Hypothetical_protein [Hexamita inflata]|uniref:Hypothetical_protein n=1 Tax=Hexamita inflata TaxID=28002 RepID=A0AA86UYU0_9EUKA|nr:Hypothetical protein HINF_LOCUS61154 [Hexamita inflata]